MNERTDWTDATDEELAGELDRISSFWRETPLEEWPETTPDDYATSVARDAAVLEECARRLGARSS